MTRKMKRILKKFNKKKTHHFDFSFKKNLNNLFKSNKFSMLEVVLLLFVTLVFGVMIGYFATFNRVTTKVAPHSLISEVYDSLLNNYYKDVDIENLDKAAIKGIIDYLDDEYTFELEDSQYNELKEQINGYFCGIGVTVTYENDKLTIIKVLEDSAAHNVGLEVDDIITHVDGIKIDSENYINLIKGKCGTKVSLHVLRGEDKLIFNIVREAVTLEHINSQYFDVNDKYVGYIDVDVFSYNSFDLFKKHLNRLEDKDIKSLIIDLRNNPGGVVASTRQILNLFFEKNTTLYSFESRNKKTIMKDGTSEHREYPIIILVNDETASAAEIFTYAFKENYNDIKIIGKTTYGKNTIQTNLSLTEDYGIKYTSSQWFSPNGETVKDKGISPDVEIAAGGSNFYDDYQLQAAIDLLK